MKKQYDSIYDLNKDIEKEEGLFCGRYEIKVIKMSRLKALKLWGLRLLRFPEEILLMIARTVWSSLKLIFIWTLGTFIQFLQVFWGYGPTLEMMNLDYIDEEGEIHEQE